MEKATGLTCTIREISKNYRKLDQRSDKLPLEAVIWRKLDHPNVLKLLEVVQDYKSVYLIAEGCPGTDFAQYLKTRKSFSEAELAALMTQILGVLSASQRQNIIYRNLRPSSFVMVPGVEETLKLVDFGSACSGCQQEKLKREMSDFLAPEVRINGVFSEKCDMWSAGMLMLLVCTGETAASPAVLLSGLGSKLSIKAKDLLSQLLATEPANRPTAVACLSHPWLRKYAVDTDLQSTLAESLANAQEKGAPDALKRAVLTFVCTRLMGLSELGDLKKLFQRLDENADGRISKAELLKGIHALSNKPQSAEEADNLFKLLDCNHSGTIEYTEFLVMTTSDRKVLTDHNLRIAFNSLDLDQSGKVGVEELKRILKVEGATEEAWKVYVGAVDLSGDGEINYEEFKAWVTRVFRSD